MANTPRVSYKRAPSKELQGLLMPGGDLSWLVELGKREVAGYQQDVHFRGKEIHSIAMVPDSSQPNGFPAMGKLSYWLTIGT